MNVSLPIEIQALIHLGASVFSTEKKADTQAFLSKNTIDWEKTYQLACFHQIRPLILRGVSQFPNCPIPDTILLKLKQDAQQLAFHGLRQTNELRRLLNLYKENGILAIPYKGVWLAHTYYGDFGMREFSDIDLFVYEKDIPAIKKIMIAEGYHAQLNLTPQQETMMMRILCEYNFDLHDKDNNRLFHIEPHYKSNGLSDGVKFLTLHDLEQRLIETSFANTSIKRFSVEDELLLIIIHHGMKEGWTLLKYLFDVYAILKKEQNSIDWEYVLTKAKHLKITIPLYIGLLLIQDLFDLKLPNIIETEAQDAKIQTLVRIRYQNLSNLPTKNSTLPLFFFNLKCLDSWFDRLKIISHRLFLPHLEDILFLSLPPQLSFLYIFIRPIRGLFNIKTKV